MQFPVYRFLPVYSRLILCSGRRLRSKDFYVCAVSGAHFRCIPEVAMLVKGVSVKVQGISMCVHFPVYRFLPVYS